MKISIEFLKQESCNFDLECVFELNLNSKGKYIYSNINQLYKNIILSIYN